MYDRRSWTMAELLRFFHPFCLQNEPQQSIMVNVWMVQDWYDEFLDWSPLEYEMINKTIVPYTVYIYVLIIILVVETLCF